MKILPLILPTMTVCVVAQTQATTPTVALPERGVLNTLEMGVVLGSDPTTLALKEAGVQNGTSNVIAMPDVANGGVRNFPAAYITQFLGYSGTLVFDALSTFNDLVPIFFDDTPGAPIRFIIDQVDDSDEWAILATAITTNVNGVDASTIYGYYPENPGFPRQLRSGIYHEILPAEWTGLGGGTAGTQIVAMDIGLGLIHAGEGELQQSLVTNTQSLFFSLTNASAAALWQAGNDLGNPVQQNPNSTEPFTGGTVFRVDYGNNGEITGVFVHYEYSDLLLSAADELDALAICVPTASTPPNPQLVSLTGPDFVIFSTTDPTRELMVRGVASGTSSVIAGPLLTNLKDSPLPASGQVTGVCAQDPDASVASRNQPIALLTSELDFLGLSAFATNAPIPAETQTPNADSFDLHLSISGWNGKTPGPRDMYLGMLVNGQQQPLIPLPQRTAADTDYHAQHRLLFPWLPQQTHTYMFAVMEYMPGTQTLTDTTYAMRLVRSQ